MKNIVLCMEKWAKRKIPWNRGMVWSAKSGVENPKFVVFHLFRGCLIEIECYHGRNVCIFCLFRFVRSFDFFSLPLFCVEVLYSVCVVKNNSIRYALMSAWKIKFFDSIPRSVYSYSRC